MVAYSILNYLLYNSTFDLSHNLIKKPLSLLGNILHAGLPMVSQVIYNYFLLNKVVAAVILSLLLIGFTIFFINEKIPIKNIFKAFLFVLIIFYPRIFAVGNIRINGIIVFWLMILLYLFLTNLGLSVKVIKPIILVIIIFFSVTFILTAKDNLQILTNYKRNTSELSQMVGNNKNLLILNDQYAVTLPSEIYYYKNNSFGVDTSFNVLPIFYNRELRNNFTFNKRMLEIGSEGYIFKIKSLDPLLYLSYFKDMIKEEGIQILKSIPSPSGRGSSYLEIKLPQNFSNNVIYFNGKDWDKINKKKKILRSIRHDKASLKKTGFK